MNQEEKLDLLELYVEDLIMRTILAKIIGSESAIIVEFDRRIDKIKEKILEEIKL